MSMPDYQNVTEEQQSAARAYLNYLLGDASTAPPLEECGPYAEVLDTASGLIDTMGTDHATDVVSNFAELVELRAEATNGTSSESKGQEDTEPDEETPAPTEWKRTDYGNAERLVHYHGRNLRYCFPWGEWLAWDGTRWQPDASGQVQRYAKETVRGIWHDAAQVRGDGGAKLAKHARKSESAARLDAMIRLAQSELGIPVQPEELDADPWTLNLQSGTAELRTGKHRSHRRKDLYTKVAGTEHKPDAECPRWRQFLREVFNGNEALIRFVQKALGYTLTGSTREHVLFILHGTGANGKSVFLETASHVLGDYAQSARAEMLMNSGRRSGGPSEAEAALHGARMVTTNETSAGGRLDEATVKRLTGGDTVRARKLYQQEFEFEPTHKIWFATNHKPEIRGTDHAIWRRIRLIPFRRTFSRSEQDETLSEKLRDEAPGILAWMIEGCKRWQQEGLKPPEVVQQATRSYRSEMDVLGTFLEECTVRNVNASAQATKLYEAYREWCDRTGERRETQTKFGMAMRERGFEKKSKADGVHYIGIGLRSDRTLSDPGEASPTETNAF